VGDVAERHFENWSVQVRKGVLELAVLNTLLDGERYGYEMVKALASVPALSVSEGTLYPILSRLRLQGMVRTRLEESSEGPARKYYALTAAGTRAARDMQAGLEELTRACKNLRAAT
jgi:PadR family transcriptional regulator, regulatory protein PadR